MFWNRWRNGVAKPTKIAVDATAMISFLLGGKAISVFDSPDVDSFITTEFNIEEVQHMIPKLSEAYRFSRDHLLETLEKLKRTKLKVLGRSDYHAQWKKAYEIMSPIDEKDTDLLALALTFGCPVWTQDSDFQEPSVKKVIAAYSTGPLLKILYGR